MGSDRVSAIWVDVAQSARGTAPPVGGARPPGLALARRQELDAWLEQVRQRQHVEAAGTVTCRYARGGREPRLAADRCRALVESRRRLPRWSERTASTSMG